MKKTLIMMLSVLSLVAFSQTARADSVAILRQGLLGAGTGAIATAATGGRGDGIWQGALIGAGVNVVGGALLDVITGQQVGTVYVNQPRQVAYVSQPASYSPARYAQPSGQQRRKDMREKLRRMYKTGFDNGYRQGYQDGYSDAMYDL